MLDDENRIEEFLFLGPNPLQGLDLTQNQVKMLRLAEYLLFPRKSTSGFCHTPYLWLPWTRNVPTIITVHDLLPLTHPSKLVKDSLRAALLSSSIKRADFIIAVSEATKNEILGRFQGLKEEKIKVVHHGLSQSFLSDNRPPCVDGERPFLLYVGGRKGYKNFLKLVRAYAASKLPHDFDLRVVGGGSPDPQELSCLQSINVSDKITFTQAHSDDDLKAIYQRALALIYPSEVEGFGFPILEALASECPVICFRQSSMKEIAGDFGIWLEELTPHGLEEAVKTATDNRSTIRIKQALSYARNFSWDLAYMRHKAIYNNLGASQ
jgi:glycosyltransferase involved in cell wall biosynthesis